MTDAAVPPIVVTSTAPSQAGTGDGRTLLATPDHQPNIIVQYVSPLAQILVRALKTYVNSMIGFITAGSAGAMPQVLNPSEGWHFIVKAASLAVFPALFSMLTNVAILLGKLDQKFPALQA